MLKRVDHIQISVPVGQEENARNFYIGHLGFKPVARPIALAQIPGFWMQSGSIEVHVGIEDNINRLATNAHPAFEVDNLEELRAQIILGGGSIDESIPIPGRNRVEFRDPFGNRIEFLQYLPGEG